MTGFLAGLFIGSALGVICMALLRASSDPGEAGKGKTKE